MNTDIKQVLALKGFPQDCEFVGYGIVDNDEYLLSFDAELGTIQRAWGNAPLLACTFSDYEQASVVRDKINASAKICEMFENNLNRYITIPSNAH